MSSNSAVTASVSATAPSSTKPAAAAQHVQPVIEQSTCTLELELVVNEVLFFVHNKFDCMPKADMRSTIADFYREDEILEAKQVAYSARIWIPLCVSLRQYSRFSKSAPV